MTETDCRALPGSTTSAAANGGTATAPAVVQMADLQNILQNMGMAPATATVPATPDSSSSGTEGTTTTINETEEEVLLRRAIEESLKDENAGGAGDDDESSTKDADQGASGTS